MTRCLATLAVLLIAGGTAAGYVRTRTTTGVGTPVYWPGSCTFLQPDNGPNPDLSTDEVASIVKRSIQNWLVRIPSCSSFQLSYDAPAELETHPDGRNVVKFRTDTWCHPNDDLDQDVCHDRGAVAITTVFFIDDPGNPSDGQIIDADIELNSVHFTFVDEPSQAPLRPGTDQIADLENTLTHELGHLMGLDHTCHDDNTKKNAVDQNGNPPPDCALLPAAEAAMLKDATMYNGADPGETKKRSPEADDIAGICSIYPLATHSCERTDLSRYRSGGCDLTHAQGPALPFSALFVGFLLVGAFCCQRRFTSDKFRQWRTTRPRCVIPTASNRQKWFSRR